MKPETTTAPRTGEDAQYSVVTGPTGQVHYLVSGRRHVASFCGSLDGKDNAACALRDERERAFIVRAVNSHAALVAALDALLCHPVGIDTSRAKIEQARAALAAARNP